MCFFDIFQYLLYLPFILVCAFHSLQKLDQNNTIRIEFYYFPKILIPDVSEMSICIDTLSTPNVNNIGNAFTKIHTHSIPNLWTFTHTMCYTKSPNFWVKESWKLPFHEKNQNFEILRLEYLLNTYKYAKNFFCFFLWFWTYLNRFQEI